MPNSFENQLFSDSVLRCDDKPLCQAAVLTSICTFTDSFVKYSLMKSGLQRTGVQRSYNSLGKTLNS